MMTLAGLLRNALVGQDFRVSRLWTGKPAAGQYPGEESVCAANGFWRGGPTLYKFPYGRGP
jgi:hypothetical protein